MIEIANQVKVYKSGDFRSFLFFNIQLACRTVCRANDMETDYSMVFQKHNCHYI